MAVTGPIAELPLPELLNMMRHRAGRLVLTETQQVSQMVLHFTPGYLTGCVSDGRILRTELQVVDKLVGVTTVPVGNFSFEPQHASSVPGSVRINVDRLALVIVGKVDELSFNKAQLPSPQRVFRLVPTGERPAATPGLDEDPDLCEFLQAAADLLVPGISADKLATVEQISVEQTQLYLYKLGILGLIEPIKRDEVWAQLDRVLSTKSTPIRLDPDAHPVPASPHAPFSPPSKDGAPAPPPPPPPAAPVLPPGVRLSVPLPVAAPPPPPAKGPHVLPQRRITRLTQLPAKDDPDPPPEKEAGPKQGG